MAMRHIIAAAAFVLATTASAQADELKPTQARDVEAQGIDLGAVTGVVYYTIEPGGFHVVATLSSQVEDATPIRVEAVLARGQSVLLSTPHGAGEAPEAVAISREADVVFVRKLAAVN